MPVEFSNFPANWRIPLFYVEVDPSMAGLPFLRQPALMVGHMFTAAQGISAKGTALPDVPVPIGRLSQAQAFFGRGSMLAAMFEKFFDNSYGQEVWALPVAEPVSGAIATGIITVLGPATDFGTIYLYVAGRLVQIGVAQGDSATIMATNIAAAINADPDLPVTAVAAVAVVTVKCKWKGQSGNNLYLMANYYGHIGGEDYPSGVSLTFPVKNILAGGTGIPLWTNAIANIYENDYKYAAMPFVDQQSINAWEFEYGFGDTGRWGWLRQQYGLVFSAYRADYVGMLAWGSTQNSGIYTVMGIEPDSPSPEYEWAAAYASKAARAFLNDPARPLQTLELTGILPATHYLRFATDELQTFTTNGIATQKTSPDNVPMILRESTTYQVNIYGVSDDSYELCTTMATLWTLFNNFKHMITQKYPRHKLADDGTRFGVGQAIVTPKIIKAEIVAQYVLDEFVGLVENISAFKNNLIVERDFADPNRVNVLYPPDLVNQLRIFAVLGQFRLQYNRGVDTAIGALSTAPAAIT